MRGEFSKSTQLFMHVRISCVLQNKSNVFWILGQAPGDIVNRV